MKQFKWAERVYYKYDDTHPFEHQPQNESQIYGKGRIAYFLENGEVAVSTDTSHNGRQPEDPLLVFNPEDLLTLEEYFKLPEDQR